MISNELRFLASALTTHNRFISSGGILDWIEERREAHRFSISRLPFQELTGWQFNGRTGDLEHVSGKFFSITGVWVETDFGPTRQWSQPIINQPEVGILGFLAKEFDGILHFLVQVKMEPGNINFVQLSPTVQATRSNYTRVHNGKSPRYLEFFLDSTRGRVLVDSLQSEQGARFLRKRNRNVVVETTEDVEVHEDYRWMTLGQLGKLARCDNILNMDARTVLSCIPFAAPELVNRTAKDALRYVAAVEDFGRTVFPVELSPFSSSLLTSLLSRTEGSAEANSVISWLTRLKTTYSLNVEQIPLKYVDKWCIGEHAIYHEGGRYFSVIGVNVQAESREVPAWSQPLVKPQDVGVVGYAVKEVDGILQFLIQGKVEPGNFDIVEMAPTVQCITGNYHNLPASDRPAFVDDVVCAEDKAVIRSSFQSEEGGRFYRETNQNVIIGVQGDFAAKPPEEYTWVSLGQLKEFIRYNNFLNVEARCLLTSLNLLD